MLSDGSTNRNFIFVVAVGIIFLFTAITIAEVRTNPRASVLLPLGTALFGVIVAVGVVMLLLRQQLPVKTITITKADGTTETYTGRVSTRLYLMCPECGSRFNPSGHGYSESGSVYTRDPERYATKLLRWHLIRIHRYDRLQAQKVARTTPFQYEERPA